MSKRTRRERNQQKAINKKQSKEALKKWQEKRGIHEFAQKLRENMPASEVWFLDLFIKEKLGIYLYNNVVIGHYIADYVYKKLVLEIDDPTHLSEEQKAKDKLKDQYYENKGYRVVRIKAWDQFSYEEGIKKIRMYLALEQERKLDEELREWERNKKRKKDARNKDKVAGLRTRPLTEWEQRRMDYIRKKKSMK